MFSALKSTESKSAKSKSKSTESKSTESKSTKSESAKSKSKSKSTESKSKSTESKSKSAKSTKSESEFLNKMLKQLENKKLRHLLLNGIPQSGHFNIDQNDENVKRWINAQDGDNSCKNRKTNEETDHKITAQFFLDTVRYIPHAELIATFRKIIDKFFKELDNKQYIILSEREEKSGYFFTMIFLLIVKENKDYYNPIDIFINPGSFERKPLKFIENEDFVSALNSNKENISIMQINDADYSGTQTINSIIEPIQHITQKYEFTNVHTFLLRGFTNDKAIKAINQYNEDKIYKKYKKTEQDNPLHNKIHYIYGSILPTLEKQLNEYNKITDEQKEKIKECFKWTLDTINMYFDHKVAAVTSSASINFIDNQKLNAGDASNGTTGIPLIKICDPDPKKIKIDEDTQEKGMEQYRCPAAWYKYLNYDTGEVDFSKIPRILPLKKTKKKRVNTKAMRRKRRRSRKTKTN